MTTNETSAAIQAKAASALARGNDVLAELGFRACDDTAALSRGIDELKLGYKDALKKLAGVEGEIVQVRRLQRAQDMQELREQVEKLLGVRGVLSTIEIMEKLACGKFSADDVYNAIRFLDWNRVIISGDEGWKLVGDDPVALSRHWRSPHC